MLVEALEHASQDIFHDTVIVLLATSCMTKDCLVFNRRIQIKTVKFQFAKDSCIYRGYIRKPGGPKNFLFVFPLII